jgi:hypothetical protein
MRARLYMPKRTHARAPTRKPRPAPAPARPQVIRAVLSGARLERPAKCPAEMYALMQDCWAHDPAARPTFQGVIQRLA